MRVWIALGLLIGLIFGVQFVVAVFANANCPAKTYGSNNATVIKYFSSPLCTACWVQKPILENFAAEYGDEMMIEEYNADYCRDAAAPHIVQGVPAFLVDGKLIYGLQNKEALEEMIA